MAKIHTTVIIVLKQKQQFGPFSLTQLESYVKSGDFLLTDYCWTDGWSEWRIIANLVTRLPECGQTEVAGSPASRPEIPKEDIPKNRAPLSENDPTDRTNQPVNVKGSAIDCNKLTSMAMFGFFGPKKEHSEPQPEFIPRGTTLIHLARKSQIIDHCAISEVPGKIQAGLVLSSDWWFNEKSGKWEPVYDLEKMLGNL